jgi:hypothetical protein
MARTIAEIQAEIIAYKNTQPELAVYNSTSRRAIWLLWTYVIATSIAVFEQILDVFTANNESILARSAAASLLWVQSKMFDFQFSATNPQVVQLINTIPQYPEIRPDLRILTACSVTSVVSNEVKIKVAKSDPYQSLTTPELNAAQSYINTIGVAGINYDVISLAADRLFIEADIYFQGQFSAVIQQTVIDTINNYLQTLSKTNFDGSIKMTDLEAVIRNAIGVNDVLLKNVSARPNAVSFGSGTDLILNTAVVERFYNSEAGYLVEEDTSGETFSDTLTFIPQ